MEVVEFNKLISIYWFVEWATRIATEIPIFFSPRISIFYVWDICTFFVHDVWRSCKSQDCIYDITESWSTLNEHSVGMVSPNSSDSRFHSFNHTSQDYLFTDCDKNVSSFIGMTLEMQYIRIRSIL